MLAAFAVANLVYLAYDAFRFDHLPLWVLAGRGALALALVTGVLRVGRTGGGRTSGVITAVAGASLVCWFAVVVGAGGSSSAYFVMVPASPLIVAAAFPENALATPILAVIAMAGGLALLTAEGVSPARRGDWAGVALFLGLSAIVGAHLFRVRARRELAAEKAHAEAMEQLAESERRRAASERLAVVGELAAGVAHEINNPLGYVKSNVAFLRGIAGGCGDPEAAEVVADIATGVDRIAQIVADLRSFSRDVPDDAETCEVESVVDEALRFASYRVGCAATLMRKVGAVPPIRVPRRRLVQALVNLLLNAADAAAETPASRGTLRPWIRLEAGLDGGMVRFEVEDSGPGVAPALKARIFNPFFTTKGNKGTGLGLAVSLENVKRCGGTLEVGDGAAGGALFTIRIPAAGLAAASGA